MINAQYVLHTDELYARSEAFVEFTTPQASTALKHHVADFGKDKGPTKQYVIHFVHAKSNPFKTTPKDAPNRNKSGPGQAGPYNAVPTNSSYNNTNNNAGGAGGAGGFRGGRGGYSNRGGGNFTNSFSGGMAMGRGGGGGGGGGYNAQNFAQNPMMGGFNQGVTPGYGNNAMSYGNMNGGNTGFNNMGGFNNNNAAFNNAGYGANAGYSNPRGGMGGNFRGGNNFRGGRGGGNFPNNNMMGGAPAMAMPNMGMAAMGAMPNMMGMGEYFSHLSPSFCPR